MELEEWLTANIKGEFRTLANGAESKVLFAVICWLLWKGRNELVFPCERSRVDVLVRNAEGYACNIARAKYRKLVAGPVTSRDVKWTPPDPGWVKVNIDGAPHVNGSWSAVGGVFRDSVGEWIEGFRWYLGKGDRH